MKGKDLISIADLTLEEIYEIFDVSKSLKEKNTQVNHIVCLKAKHLE
ncbi:MAG: hypothetical protein MZV64_53935 [Ignavibacteriales bacterium]|nr:hypothetical protein [Ignavibacteriales bacterium]